MSCNLVMLWGEIPVYYRELLRFRHFQIWERIAAQTGKSLSDLSFL